MENLNTLQNDFFKTYSYIANSTIGTSGGQLILWKTSLYELSSSIAMSKSITIVISIIGPNYNICVTNIYTPHKATKRIQMLQTVMKITETIPLPYKIIAGDFNIILNIDEWKGGIHKLDKDLEVFQPTIDKLSLVGI